MTSSATPAAGAAIPEVTVVITTYNQSKLVAAAVASAATQDPRPEIIVVDDASTDDTAAVAARAVRKVDGQFIGRHQNGGVAAARNAGLDAATGRYVMFLDGDDLLEPGKLAGQLAVFRRHPATDVCYCDAKLLRGTHYDHHTLKDVWPPHQSDILLRLLQGNCIAVHAALLPTQLAREFRFREELRRAEDWDLWLRLAAAGKRFSFLDQPLVVYRRDGETLSRDIESSVQSAWQVLAGLDPADFTPAQRDAYDTYRRGIRLALADLRLRAGDQDRAEQELREAQLYGPIGRYRSLTLSLLPRYPRLARWLYLAANSLAQRRNRPVNQI